MPHPRPNPQHARRIVWSTSVALAVLTLVALAGCVIAWTGQLHAETLSRPNVLILNSYHRGYQWSDDIMNGMDSVLRTSSTRPELFTEYLDSKRIPVQQAFSYMAQLIALKYGARHFDAILTSDDNALDFVLAHRADLFPNLPVVFCGINEFSPERVHGDTMVTGIVERRNYSGTVELALRLHPGTRKIVAVSDATTTGRLMLDDVWRAVSSLEQAVTYEELSGLTRAELRYSLGTLPPNTVIIFVSYFLDREGRSYTLEEAFEILNSAPHIPVYTVVGTYLGLGAVGGELLSARLQGAYAARMLDRILGGTPIEKIPPYTESPTQTVLDWNAMQHFHIDEQRLPPGSVVINRPESFYLKYKYHIWAAAGFTALQTAVILILLANIIRRRAAELRLRESEEKFRRIFENIRDGYFLTRMNGTLQLANKALADMFGYDSPETMQGIDVRESLYNSPRDRDRMLSRLMETGDLYGYEMTFRRKDGSVFLCDCNIHLLYDDAGTPFATEGLLRDVTERKLTEAMMVQNQKMMSLGGLAAGMAHEINNPLGAITQGAQNIMRRVSPGLSANEKAATDAGTSLEAVHDYLERRGVIRMIRGIQESGARAARIASDMLNFSRRSESEHAPHDIHAIIDDTLTLAANDYDLSKRYDFKKIEITTDYARDIPPVICSPSEIGQVFLNIFKNATQAMTAQHTGDAPRLSLGTKRNDGHVVITISDNGPGMDADTLTHLFDPFFTTKRMGEGTGLGMSVSRHIIENNHCGTIRATSAPGQGATFVITLPFGECLRKDDATAP